MKCRALFTFAQMVSLSLLASVCLGQTGDEDFANPDGEDIYGPKYKSEPVPADMSIALNDQCGYELESFINRTIARDGSECWIVHQIPASGTILTGPGEVVVQLQYTCDGFDEYWARLPITLVDITPPEISVNLSSNRTAQVSFGGVTRYVGDDDCRRAYHHRVRHLR